MQQRSPALSINLRSVQLKLKLEPSDAAEECPECQIWRMANICHDVLHPYLRAGGSIRVAGLMTTPSEECRV